MKILVALATGLVIWIVLWALGTTKASSIILKTVP